MSRLSKTQIYAIKWLDYQNFAAIKIADELKLTLKQVSTVLEKQSKTGEENKIETKSSPVSSNKPKNFMVNQTAVKKTNSVSIMTKEASAIHDELQKKAEQSSVKRPNNDIYRPNSR
jgi:hypothetical protein